MAIPGFWVPQLAQAHAHTRTEAPSHALSPYVFLRTRRVHKDTHCTQWALQRPPGGGRASKLCGHIRRLKQA